jgi:UMF1 family MFS transporter
MAPLARVGESLRSLRGTLRDLRRYREAGLMLVAFLIYNDGIGTIVRMAAIYGTEIGIGRSSLIGSILLVQFIGIPFAFLFGTLAGRIGAKRMILIGLGVYVAVSIYGYFLRTGRDFLVLACMVGIAQGGTQALSRSLFASMIPARRSGEFFGVFAVMEKFAGIFGPGIFSLAVALTGSSRGAILSVLLFFLAGGALLLGVDVAAGRRRVALEDSAAEAAGD